MESLTRLALISPNKQVYSETFIKAHKELLDAKTFYYYGGYLPNSLEGEGLLNTGNILVRGLRLINQKLNESLKTGRFTLYEDLLRKSFLRNRIEVVMAEYGPTGCAVLSVCRALKIPLIVHFHGVDASKKSVLKEYQGGYKEIFEYAKSIIVVSKPMRETLINLGAPEEKLVYNPCGANSSFLDVVPTYSENAFLSIGRFVDKKAPYYTILAFNKILGKTPDATLYMAGDGVLLNACKNLVRYLGIEKNVHFLGVISPKEFQNRLSKVKVFLQHSVIAENGDTEGNPVGIMEAQAAGIPVVSTYHAGIPEVVNNGETGILVSEHDVEGMAKAMSKLLSSDEEIIKMGTAAKKRIKAHFTLDHHIQSLNDVIHSAVEKS